MVSNLRKNKNEKSLLKLPFQIKNIIMCCYISNLCNLLGNTYLILCIDCVRMYC
jgi:hypothetical protein